jgi:hypothetical protein
MQNKQKGLRCLADSKSPSPKKGFFLQDKQIFCLAQRGKENAGARYAATESAWSLLAK